jgi:glycosidase
MYAYFDEEARKYRSSDNIMYFTTDHDENSWNGTEYERLGRAAKAFAVLSATAPGMPLVYDGQEAAADHRLSFFEKDTIAWDHYSLADFYTRLLKLKNDNEAMWVEKEADAEFIKDAGCFVFMRHRGAHRVLTVINLTAKPADAKIRTGDIAGDYTELFTGQKLTINKELSLHLDAWGYKVFVQ